ncbi:hypothetical protein BC830DRAFT_134830 [Chytriomyces sp. MP71]|nr:hypothetical protein BC830DRAFT_134830 [Chytriomyces sp. MP71]
MSDDAQLQALFALSNKIFLNLMWTVVNLSAIQLIVMFIQIASSFQSSNGASLWKATNTPINWMILFMVLSNVGIIIAFYEYWINSDFVVEVTTYTLVTIFSSLLQTLMMQMSWNRGKPVIEVIWPSSVKYVRVALIAYPLLQIFQNVLYLASYFVDPSTNATPEWIAGNVFFYSSSGVLIIFDAFGLICYFLYLKGLINDRQTPDIGRLKIICRYGIASIILTFCWLILLGVIDTIDWDLGNLFEQQVIITLNTIYYSLPTLYIFLQLCMKWALHNERGRSVSQRHNTIEHAKKAMTKMTSMAAGSVARASASGIGTS